MPGTPNPTIEKLAELDDLVNGDIGAAQQEVVDRLRANLPAWIAAKNTAKGWSGPNAMRVPLKGDISLAPTVITAKHKNQILVAIDETTVAEGIGGGFRNVWSLTVTVVKERNEIEQQIKTAWRTAECIKTVMRAFLEGCADGEGKLLWRSATSQSLSLSDDFEDNITLVTASFMLIQPPSYGTGY